MFHLYPKPGATQQAKGTIHMSNETVNTSTGELVSVPMTQQGARADIAALKQGGAAVFSTITGADRASKVAILNAMTNSKPVSENLGKTFNLLNVVIQAIEMEDETTKEMVSVPRIVLVDDKGEAWHAISSGLFKSLENIFGVMGNPDTWEGVPLPIKITQAGTGNRKYFTVSITA